VVTLFVRTTVTVSSQYFIMVSPPLSRIIIKCVGDANLALFIRSKSLSYFVSSTYAHTHGTHIHSPQAHICMSTRDVIAPTFKVAS